MDNFYQLLDGDCNQVGIIAMTELEAFFKHHKKCSEETIAAEWKEYVKSGEDDVEEFAEHMNNEYTDYHFERIYLVNINS